MDTTLPETVKSALPPYLHLTPKVRGGEMAIGEFNIAIKDKGPINREELDPVFDLLGEYGGEAKRTYDECCRFLEQANTFGAVIAPKGRFLHREGDIDTPGELNFDGYSEFSQRNFDRRITGMEHILKAIQDILPNREARARDHFPAIVESNEALFNRYTDPAFQYNPDDMYLTFGEFLQIAQDFGSPLDIALKDKRFSEVDFSIWPNENERGSVVYPSQSRIEIYPPGSIKQNFLRIHDKVQFLPLDEDLGDYLKNHLKVSGGNLELPTPVHIPQGTIIRLAMNTIFLDQI